MILQKILYQICRYKELFLYLFEHERAMLEEVLEFISLEQLEILQEIELVDIDGEYVFIDGRVVAFFESFLESEGVVISALSEKIEELRRKIDLALEYKEKRDEVVSIKRGLRRVESTIMKNLTNLRLHIDRVYKSIQDHQLKLTELNYYKEELEQLNAILKEIELFLQNYRPKVRVFGDETLLLLFGRLKYIIIEANKTLIALTQEVLSYINQVRVKSRLLDKVTKLKELKDENRLNASTNLEELLKEFDYPKRSLIRTLIDEEIVTSKKFQDLLKKRVKPKKEIASKVDTTLEKRAYEYIDIIKLDREFRSGRMELVEFLRQKFSQKRSEEVVQIYCKMVLMFEEEYRFGEKSVTIEGYRLKEVYSD